MTAATLAATEESSSANDASARAGSAQEPTHDDDKIQVQGGVDIDSSPPTPTELRYLTYEGNFELECSAQVTAVTVSTKDPDKSEEELLTVCLDQTVLHAQGGG